jgi:hypothetical protein
MTPRSVDVGSLRFVGYLLAAALILIPVSNLALTAWPLRPTEISWRIALLGGLSSLLPVAMIGFGLLGLLTVLSGERVALMASTILAALVALALVAVAVLFALDALQMRSALVQPQMKRQLDANAAKALISFGWAFLFFSTASFSGQRILRAERRSGRSRHSVPLGKAAIDGKV